MVKYLDFGILFDKEGDAFPGMARIEFYMPKDHRYLLDFLRADLDKISGLVGKGYAEKDRAYIIAARDALRKTHPYMTLDECKANSYINQEIIRCAWLDNENTFISQEEFEKLAILTEYQSHDPNDYLITQDADGYGSLKSLASRQHELKIQLFLLLDKSNPVYRDVPFEKRCGLYSAIVDENGNRCGSNAAKLPPCKVFFACPDSFSRFFGAVSFDDDLSRTVYLEASDLAFNEKATLRTIMGALKNIETPEKTDAHEEYRIENLENLLDLEAALMIQDRVSIGKCVSCGRYFAYQNNADELEAAYCDLPDEGGLSCLAKARAKAFSLDLQKIYSRAYKTRFERVRAGKISKADLDAWREMARDEKSRVINGEISLGEYKAIITK